MGADLKTFSVHRTNAMTDERNSLRVQLEPSTSAEDWIERLLVDAAREQRDGYLADDGFTARMMGKLPGTVTAPSWRKPALTVMWGRPPSPSQPFCRKCLSMPDAKSTSSSRRSRFRCPVSAARCWPPVRSPGAPPRTRYAHPTDFHRHFAQKPRSGQSVRRAMPTPRLTLTFSVRGAKRWASSMRNCV